MYIIYIHTCKCGARRIATEPRNTDKNQESLSILADFLIILLFSPRNRETKLLGVSCWCCHCWDLLRTVSMCLDVSQYQCKSRTLKQPAAQRIFKVIELRGWVSISTSWHVLTCTDAVLFGSSKDGKYTMLNGGRQCSNGKFEANAAFRACLANTLWRKTAPHKLWG